MVDEGSDDGGIPPTRELVTVRSTKGKGLNPRRLFPAEKRRSPRNRPSQSDPTGGVRRNKPRMTVKTPQGKRVLTSDARLHLEKLKARRSGIREKGGRRDRSIEDEVIAMDKERRVMELRVKHKKEMDRLRAQLDEEATTEYQTNDHESSLRTSAYSEYVGEECSEASYSSRCRKRRIASDGLSDEESTKEASSNRRREADLVRLQNDVALVKDFVRSHSGGIEVSTDSPLSEDIENAKIDRQLKIPSIEQFDGTTDPSDFINLFDGRMSFFGHSDVARCRFFCTCLKGTALKWFNNLPARSIDSWAMLKTKFRTRFSSNRKGGKITASLITVRQRSSESLRNFLARFRAEVAEIPDLIDELAINYLAAGVDKSRHGLLLEEFFDKNPRTLQAAMQIFEHRLTLQEAVGSIQAVSSPGRKWEKVMNAPKWSGKSPRRQGGEVLETRSSEAPQAYQQTSVPRPSKSWPPRPPREEREFSKLNTEITSILGILKTEPDYRPPRPMNPNRPFSTRYCDYHEDTGHTTERCFQLRNLVEDKIQSGQLAHFVLRDDDPLAQKTQKDKDRLIDVISGGVGAGGSSNNSQKSYARAVFHLDSKRPKKSPSPVISFSDEDYPEGLLGSHEDALVITTKIGTNLVRKILIDNGSSVDILYQGAFSRMDLGDRRLKDARGSPLYGFTGNEVRVIGIIDLPVLFGSPPQQVWQVVRFHVVNAVCSYNAILGRSTLAALRAITSIPHLKMKFPTEYGVGEMRGDQQVSRQCYLSNVLPKRKPRVSEGPSVNQVSEEVALQEMEASCQPVGVTEEVDIDKGNPDRTVKVGAHLSPEVKGDLINLLREFADLFAWKASDMPGIPETVAVHRLNIRPDVKPVKQKKRVFSAEKQQAIEEELDKLLEAGFIKQVQYPRWIANVVLVKKSNGKWRMCTDYSDLNRACPKDFYPLPNIDQLIDSTSGNELLSFMDAFAGYNQIKMAPEDQDDTAFITHRGVFAYKVVPFGLLNAGATFQRTMDAIFAPQIGRNMQIYVDDMIVKSVRAVDHVSDLKETFLRLRENSVRLNPAKCSFGLEGGRFLGFLLTQRGIEADPKQISAIAMMPTPTSMKELQVLTGCLAALRRFIPQSAKRSLPLYDALKNAAKHSSFQWDEACEQSLRDIKTFLTSPPVLVKAEPCEPLKVYLSASDRTVAAVLVKEVGLEQRAVYYISHILKEAEIRYPKIEKLVFALVVASRKLRQYFQGRQISVMTNQPLRRILHRPDMTGRLAAWTIELSQFNIDFLPRNANKSQVLSDFMAECSFNEEVNGPGSFGQEDKIWTLFTDGSSTSVAGGAGIILTSPEGFKVQQAVRFKFTATNNEAEYEALIAGIRLAQHLDVKVIAIFCDSQLVVKQILGEFKAVNERMLAYRSLAVRLLGDFMSWTLNNVERAVNHWADALSKLATSAHSRTRDPVYIKELDQASIVDLNIYAVESVEDWRSPIIEYIQGNLREMDKDEKRRLVFKARNYCLVEGKLFRRSLTEPLLRCIGEHEALVAMEEVHTGICGEHLAGKSMALKMLRHGVFWPTLRKDCEDYTRRCRACQLYGPVNRRPSVPLNASTVPCPFFMWGLDIVGPLPKCSGQKQFLVVAVDYYTKWVEAKALARIRESDMIQFFMEFIVFRFGVPRVVVTDNGSQFVGKDFEGALDQLKIRHTKASVAYPQSNGQVEITNKIILQGLKKRLIDAGKNWVDELPNVLWGYRTTPRSSTGETPFKLAYGTEAVIPLEISMESARIQVFDPVSSIEGLRLDMDLIEEVRESAQLRVAQYQKKTASYYNTKVKPRQFQVNDLVLREAAASMPSKVTKVSAPWEGPYKIAQVIRPGTYKLSYLDGSPIPNLWNAVHLKKYYQ